MTPWTVACQAPLSMEFSRQEHWSGLPFPPPGDLPDPGIEPSSPELAGGFFTIEPPGKPDDLNINDKESKEGRTGLMTEFLVWQLIVPLTPRGRQ